MNVRLLNEAIWNKHVTASCHIQQSVLPTFVTTNVDQCVCKETKMLTLRGDFAFSNAMNWQEETKKEYVAQDTG